MFGRASTIRSANRLHWRRASASDSNAGTGGASRAKLSQCLIRRGWIPGHLDGRTSRSNHRRSNCVLSESYGRLRAQNQDVGGTREIEQPFP
jgi:hypothetical protein